MTEETIPLTISISKHEKEALITMLQIGAQLVNRKMSDSCKAASAKNENKVNVQEFTDWVNCQRLLKEFFIDLNNLYEDKSPE